VIDPPDTDRASRPIVEEIPTDPDEIARITAANALRQFDGMVELIESGIRAGASNFVLRPSHMLELNRLAIEGLTRFAGVYRAFGMTIQGSQHQPPPAKDVPRLVEDLCDYINERWQSSSPIQLASYPMWRVNWIHPFEDGNGRTSRAISYAVLCIRLGYRLPGALTIPDQISADKKSYYVALEEADRAFAEGRTDVSQLERLLADLLAKQLYQVHEDAMGNRSA
jgi:Fic family protein